MSLFNRYDAYLKDLEFALWEGNNKYCNPKDYFVTEEECRKYLEDLKNGQELNREWNKKHRNRFFRTFVPDKEPLKQAGGSASGVL